MTRSKRRTDKDPPPCLQPRRDVSWSSTISSHSQPYVEPRSPDRILQRESLGSIFSQENDKCENVLQLSFKTSEGSLDMVQSLSSTEMISNFCNDQVHCLTFENSTILVEEKKTKNSVEISQTLEDNRYKVDAVEW
jgi:hypothetical protein